MRVHIIQMKSNPGNWKANIKEANRLVTSIEWTEKSLVLLPELFASGYVANELIKEFAEPEDGRTINWMEKTAIDNKIYLAGGIAEWHKGEIYNRYYLVNPDGMIEGVTQKHNAEAYCFKGFKGSYIIESSMGRIAAVICADNHSTAIIEELQELKPDILLMPHAWPSIEKQDSDLANFPLVVNELLGIPVVFINPVGAMAQMKGILGSIMKRMNFELRGHSSIISEDGTVLAAMTMETGIVHADIDLSQRRSLQTKVPNYSGSIVPGSGILRRLIIPIDVFLGSRYYKKHISRSEL